MRVALVNQPWGHIEPPVVTGGSIPIVLYELARHLSRSCDVLYYTRGRFHKHEVVCEDIRYRYIPVAADKALLKVLDRVGHYTDCRKPLFASGLAYLGYALGVAYDLHRQQVDIAHVNNLTQLIPVIRRFNPKIKIVVHMHCEWLNQLDAELIRRRISQCDLIVGCSDFIVNKVRRRFPEFANRCATVYNGVDPDRFTSRWDRRDVKRGHQITFVGRVSPEKGSQILISAFAKLAPRFPDAKLVIVGPEEINPPDLVVPFSDDPKVFDLLPLYAEGRPFRALLDQLSTPLGDRIEFTGNLMHSDELVKQYQSADVCVIPSIWEEPFGMPVVEAMAAGVPVIATRGGAFPELVAQGQTGLLVERGDVDDLAAALNYLLCDPALRESMGRAGRERAVEVFAWERIADELLERYQKLLSGKPANSSIVRH